MFFSEHIFFLCRKLIRVAISKIESPGLQKERRDRFLVRKQYFEESLSKQGRLPTMADAGGEITRESLEEDARRSSLQIATPEDRFWAHQRGWRETVAVGQKLIEKAGSGAEAKKDR
jgi:hypothetical protein